ncbi:MAG: GntR family transcriptional regulator [Pseudomonadota bacterium]
MTEHLQTDTKSSGEAAYDALLLAISDGRLMPGDRIREVEVSNLLNLSRTPIREALRRLESEGIVEHRARIGAVVRKLSHGEIVELYEMRVVLEKTAAEMAAKHASEAEIDTLADLNADIAAHRGDPVAAASINQEFHKALYRACRNRFLLDAAKALNNSLILLGITTFTDEERIDVVVDQHQAVIDALRARDPDRAGEAAEAHLQTSLRKRLKVING